MNKTAFASPGNETLASSDVHDRLEGATPEERVAILLDLLENQKPLELPGGLGRRTNLSGVDLRPDRLRPTLSGDISAPPSWWDTAAGRLDLSGVKLAYANLSNANLEGADLRNIDLNHAVLRDANLQRALLESANLEGADLAGANLQEALLSGANLQGAMLEDANFRKAGMRFADLSKAALENATLARADLWGARLEKIEAANANLRGAHLEEANLQGADLTAADLSQAVLRKANLQNAKLQSVKLTGALLRNANLEGAVLKNTRLEGMDLSECKLTHIHLAGTHLDQAQFSVKQLGGAIGEELTANFEAAASAYLALEQNFNRRGDLDSASWAYRKKRRMQKCATRRLAGRAFAKGRWFSGVRNSLKSAGDQLAEWVCDYGESVPRIIISLLALMLLFMAIYGVTGSVVRIEQAPNGGIVRVTTRSLSDLALFSTSMMLAKDTTHVGLAPRGELTFLLTNAQTFLGLFLSGLLGFVLGHRLRRNVF